MRRDWKCGRSSGGERRPKGRCGVVLLRAANGYRSGWRIQAGWQVVASRGGAQSRRDGGRGGYGHADRGRRSRDRWRGRAHGSPISRGERVGRHGESPGEPGGSSPGRWTTGQQQLEVQRRSRSKRMEGDDARGGRTDRSGGRGAGRQSFNAFSGWARRYGVVDQAEESGEANRVELARERERGRRLGMGGWGGRDV